MASCSSSSSSRASPHSSFSSSSSSAPPLLRRHSSLRSLLYHKNVGVPPPTISSGPLHPRPHPPLPHHANQSPIPSPASHSRAPSATKHPKENCSFAQQDHLIISLFPLPSSVSTDDNHLASGSSVSSSTSSSPLQPSSPARGTHKPTPSFASSVCSYVSSTGFKTYTNPLSETTQVAAREKQCRPCPRSQQLTEQAFPLPLPPFAHDSTTVLREFSFEELSGGCQNFAPQFFIREGGVGPVYRAIVKDGVMEDQTLDVAVTCVHLGSCQNFKKWKAEVDSLSRLTHPHLCKLLGFSANHNRPPDHQPLHSLQRRERLLVYEHPCNGSLDRCLYGRVDKAPLDWATRLKIAAGAAKGLAFLHERASRQQIIYTSFKTINIQMDQSFDAKLSDYGFASKAWNDFKEHAQAHCLSDSEKGEDDDDRYAPPEAYHGSGEVTCAGNVWSFGVVLLELLTGRQHMDAMFPAQERDLVQWTNGCLEDAKRLYLVMDPELKGRYPTASAKRLADLALCCLSEEPLSRPRMQDVVQALATLYEPSLSHSLSYSTSSCKLYYHYQSRASLTPSPSSTRNHNHFTRLTSRSSNPASVLATPLRSFPRSMENCSSDHASIHMDQSCVSNLLGYLSGELNSRCLHGFPI